MFKEFAKQKGIFWALQYFKHCAWFFEKNSPLCRLLQGWPVHMTFFSKTLILAFFWSTNSVDTSNCTFLRILQPALCCEIFLLGFTRVVYHRVQKRKIYFEIPAFLQTEGGKSRAGKFKTSNENKNVFVFVFIWFWISRSWSSSFIIQKGGNFKIIFLVPYPIIYNPA